MHRIAAASLVAIALLTACSSEKKTEPSMPKVEALTLDVAKSNIKNAGFSQDVEVEGGGALGIVQEANWTVCTQSPEAGQPLNSKPKLTVARECADRAAKTAAATQRPTTPDQVPATSSPARLTPSNPALARVLATKDDCSPSFADFAAQHQGSDAEFDGTFASVQAHGDAKTRFDFLVRAGDSGPNFKFEDEGTADLHMTGKVPDSIAAGQPAHFVARIDRYNATQCLLVLEPVSVEFK